MEALYFSPLLLGINLMLASAVACTALWWFSRPYRGPGVWTSGVWTLILGLLLFFGYMATGSPLLNIAGNALQLAGEALLMVGVFRFLGLPPPWWMVPASAGAMSAVMSWHWWVAPINTELVVTIYSAIGGLLPVQACRALWSAPGEPELRSVRRFVALAFGGFALVTLVRGLLGLIDGLQGIEHTAVTRSVPYLLPYNFGIPLWVTGLVGLALLTMRRILLDSQRHARAAAASAARFERLMSVTHAGVLLLREGHIVDANPMLERLFARPRQALLGQPLAALFDPDETLATQLAEASGQALDRQALRGDGGRFSAELSVATLEDGGLVAEIRDVSPRKALEDELRRLATHDPLTAALNRRAFAERAEHERQRSLRQGSPLSLALLDLDHFKQINDRYGHAMGDQVLQRFSQLCQRHMRRTDLFCRFGGEEFVLLLPDSDPASAAALLERLRERWSAERLATPQGELHATVSIGLARLAQNDSLEQLLARADAALYRAKRAGRDRLEQAD